MRRHKFSAMLIVALTVVLLTLASTAWAAEYKVLYKFQGGADGLQPHAGLIFDTAGNLYGTTGYGGGAYGEGTVFKLTPNPDGSWSESVIHSFSGADGSWPYTAGLILDAAGNLYGTTLYGGAYNQGTVFKLAPNPDGSWSESVLHSFGSDSDARNPCAGLIFDGAGNLYGTTTGGGTLNLGTVFKLTPNPDESWSETVLHSFSGLWTDGSNPEAGLIFDAAGNLYGTASRGGGYDYGTVFKLAPNPDGSWSESTIFNRFAGRNGRLPRAGLTLDAAGNLYGTTHQGGAYDVGTVFKLSPNPDGTWTRTKLHTFKGPDGQYPRAGLILDAAGNLYGTTWSGGAYRQGTAFKLTPNPDGSWTSRKLHSFRWSPDGAYPYAGLIFDAAGNLYGTTYSGGNNYGVVFQVTP